MNKIIGLDVSKNWLDICVYNTRDKPKYHRFANDAAGHEEMIKLAKEQEKRNPDLKLKQAEYFESVGLFEQAKTCYHHAFSLSHDENFKATALEKIGNIMANTAPQSQNFITRAKEHDFYNYELVTEEFTNNLLSDLKCDLYC